jgi:PAS domain S-box-containing protein
MLALRARLVRPFATKFHGPTFASARQPWRVGFQESRMHWDTPSAAIIVANRSGIISYWNAAASELFGYSAEEALGARLDLIVPPEYQERHWHGFHRVMNGGPPHFEGRAANIPVKCKDGQVLAFPARFVVIRDPHERPVGAMAIASSRVAQNSPGRP